MFKIALTFLLLQTELIQYVTPKWHKHLLELTLHFYKFFKFIPTASVNLISMSLSD